jgi:hypothetical protein
VVVHDHEDVLLLMVVHVLLLLVVVHDHEDVQEVHEQ